MADCTSELATQTDRDGERVYEIGYAAPHWGRLRTEINDITTIWWEQNPGYAHSIPLETFRGDFTFITKMEVTIYRCSNNSYWYKDNIGESFEVEDTYPDLRRYRVKGEYRTIDICDTTKEWESDHIIEADKPSESGITANDAYDDIRNFLQENNAPAHIKQKLFILYEGAAFWD